MLLLFLVIAVEVKSQDENTYPDHFDLRNIYPHCYSLNMPSYTGNCHSSWAFATIGAISDRMCIQGVTNQFMSVEDVIQCDTTSDGCNIGYLANSLEFFRQRQLGLVVPAVCKKYKGTSMRRCQDECDKDSPVSMKYGQQYYLSFETGSQTINLDKTYYKIPSLVKFKEEENKKLISENPFKVLFKGERHDPLDESFFEEYRLKIMDEIMNPNNGTVIASFRLYKEFLSFFRNEKTKHKIFSSKAVDVSNEGSFLHYSHCKIIGFGKGDPSDAEGNDATDAHFISDDNAYKYSKGYWLCQWFEMDFEDAYSADEVFRANNSYTRREIFKDYTSKREEKMAQLTRLHYTSEDGVKYRKGYFRVVFNDTKIRLEDDVWGVTVRSLEQYGLPDETACRNVNNPEPRFDDIKSQRRYSTLLGTTDGFCQTCVGSEPAAARGSNSNNVSTSSSSSSSSSNSSSSPSFHSSSSAFNRCAFCQSTHQCIAVSKESPSSPCLGACEDIIASGCPVNPCRPLSHLPHLCAAQSGCGYCASTGECLKIDDASLHRHFFLQGEYTKNDSTTHVSELTTFNRLVNSANSHYASRVVPPEQSSTAGDYCPVLLRTRYEAEHSFPCLTHSTKDDCLASEGGNCGWCTETAQCLPINPDLNGSLNAEQQKLPYQPLIGRCRSKHFLINGTVVKPAEEPASCAARLTPAACVTPEAMNGEGGFCKAAAMRSNELSCYWDYKQHTCKECDGNTPEDMRKQYNYAAEEDFCSAMDVTACQRHFDLKGDVRCSWCEDREACVAVRNDTNNQIHPVLMGCARLQREKEVHVHSDCTSRVSCTSCLRQSGCAWNANGRMCVDRQQSGQSMQSKKARNVKGEEGEREGKEGFEYSELYRRMHHTSHSSSSSSSSSQNTDNSTNFSDQSSFSFPSSSSSSSSSSNDDLIVSYAHCPHRVGDPAFSPVDVLMSSIEAKRAQMSGAFFDRRMNGWKGMVMAVGSLVISLFGAAALF
ncbi:putative Papain family cysteine protease [Monocercomonoides exilis]|uniref:putative Papain family cysteine protease n=1 Tax=Monocercomonoides exilis TaxID=2049356 RepID=UPI00355A428B|nr:putative Papain family cysteine protease [Monocercomonoides exilis]|eukprot:MONOS_12729.1-p1 / transcript=MONOS_12729.1 / gene=MONOS_12729 / organism=Monocercomonoides_exilis_PA203 / gene_product=unspecified product / transcript_product=unspecified product / location=Mono_scaffold00725:21032-24728(+) / protein_length=991 / sequence_SO=supercontig / SO=protein_coding / is_pseudo=false